jgi:hypothetical protein
LFGERAGSYGKRISEGCKKNIKNIRKSQVVVPFCSSFNQLFPANKKGCTCVPAKRKGCTSARQKDV